MDANRVENARRRLFLLLMTLVFTLIILSGLTQEVEEDKTEDSTGTGGSGSSPDNPLPPDPNVLRLRALADSIAAQAVGPVYPSNLSITDRFLGQWVYEGAYTDSKSVRPMLTPNLTIGYAAFAPNEPPAQTIDFGVLKGALSLQLVSLPILRAVPTLQRTDGILTITTAQAISGLDDEPLAVRADLPISGLYVSDQGVLSMVASPRKIEVFLAEKVPVPPVTEDSGGGRELQASPEPSPTPVNPSPVPSSGANDLGLSRCEILFAFRLRPVGWDSTGEFVDTANQDDDSSSGETPASESPTPVGGRLLSSSMPSSFSRSQELLRQAQRDLEADSEGNLHTRPGSWLSTHKHKLAKALGLGFLLGESSWSSEEEEFARAAAKTPQAVSDHLRRLYHEATQQEKEQEHAVAAATEVGFPRALSSSAARGRRLESAPISELYPGARFVPMYGKAVSHNCNFSLNITATAMVWSQSHFEDKAIGYSLMATTIGVILMAATTFQIVQSASQTASTRISIATIGMLAALDCYAALTHVIGGLTTPQVFSSFLTTSFVFLLLFAVLEMRFLLMVWKARRPEAFAGGWDVVRREVGALYCKFYGVLIAGMLVLYFGSWTGLRILALLAFSFWVPQIVHSVQHDTRPGFTRGYILTTSIVRLLIPAYFLACPDNLILMLTPPESRAAALNWTSGWAGQFEAWLLPPSAAAAAQTAGSSSASAASSPTDPPSWLVQEGALPSADTDYAFVSAASTASYYSGLRFLYILCGWVALQVFVLLLQSKPGFGPRWFIPYVYLPQRYDFHRKIVISADGRIQPDVAACHAWLRPRHQQQEARAQAQAAAAAGGNGGAGAAPAGGGEGANGAAAAAPAGPNRITAAFASFRSGAQERAQFAWETTVWFFNGLRVLARDGIKYSRRRAARWGLIAPPAGSPRAGQVAPSGIQMRTMPHSTSSPSSASGTPAGGSSGATASSVTSPVAALAAAMTGGRRGGYARIEEKSSDAPDEDEEEESDRSLTARSGPGGAAAERSGAAGSSGLAEEGRAPTPAVTSPRVDNETNAPEAGSAATAAATAAADAARAAAAAESRELELDELVVPEGGGEVVLECVICMDSITFPTQRRVYMICPCDHIFHKECLQPWLAQSLICPYCRLPLPEP